MSGVPQAGDRQLQFRSFADFYPLYLEQHRNLTSRRLHLGGTLLALLLAAAALLSRHWWWLLPALGAGYLPAWIGHFLFQRNAPATFRHPWYSLRGELAMLAEALSGRRRW